MNIVDYFSLLTTCADCISGMWCDNGMIGCRKQPQFSPVNREFVGYGLMQKGNRCDLGSWFFKMSYKYLSPINIDDWVRLGKIDREVSKLVNRERWPEIIINRKV